MRRRVALLLLAACCAAPAPLTGQTDGTCVPAEERAGRAFGCFVTARQELGPLPATPLYWHLDTFPTFAAAESARGPRGTVVRSLGATWLFTIADSAWRPRRGHRVARIGPLPLVVADSFAAVYMEGVFRPGMQTMVHRHPGVEAWYTLQGAMCLESPEGRLEQRAGEPGVPALDARSSLSSRTRRSPGRRWPPTGCPGGSVRPKKPSGPSLRL